MYDGVGRTLLSYDLIWSPAYAGSEETRRSLHLMKTKWMPGMCPECHQKNGKHSENCCHGKCLRMQWPTKYGCGGKVCDWCEP